MFALATRSCGKIFDHGCHGCHGWETGLLLSESSVQSVVLLILSERLFVLYVFICGNQPNPSLE